MKVTSSSAVFGTRIGYVLGNHSKHLWFQAVITKEIDGFMVFCSDHEYKSFRCNLLDAQYTRFNAGYNYSDIL